MSQQQRSVGGAFMTAMALAFQAVFDPKKEEPIAMVQPAGSDEDEDFQFHFDEDPAQSKVVLRHPKDQ